MNSQLHNLVISSIKRDESNHASATTRDQENNISELSETIVAKLTTLFNTSGLRLGRFNTEPERPLFARTMDQYFNQASSRFDNFRGFAANLGSSLASELNEGQAQNAKDGFLLSYYYSTVQVDDDTDEEITEYYLGVVFLHRINGVDIDAEELDLRDIEQINLDSLNLGARISISRFLDEGIDPAAKPISFKIGRGSDVRVYFQDFVGCSEPGNSKVDMQNVLEALEYSCSNFGFSDEQKMTAIEHASNYCNMTLNNGQNAMNLSLFAQHVFSESEHVEQFVLIAHNQFNLSESVGVDKSEIRKFGTITISNDSYRIKLNKSALSNDGRTIVWDADDECLKLYDLSEQDKNRLDLNT